MKRRSTSMKFDLVGRIIFSSNYCHWSILDKRAISMSLTWMNQLINQRMCFDLLICNFTCIEIFDIGELWLGGSCADDVTKMKFHRWRTVTGFNKIFNITFRKLSRSSYCHWSIMDKRVAFYALNLIAIATSLTWKKQLIN